MNFKFKILNFKLVTIGYIVGIVALFFYSFTQIDLSLTLSQVSLITQGEKVFQYIGYFNRPLSTYLFIGIVLTAYSFYCLLLVNIRQLSKRQIWSIIIFSSILLSIAYNAFSYDLFNYIFDAKIVTYYHQSPYEHKALDYPQDPMLSFMRWTHRVYPYGPVWLGIILPLSVLGMQYFLLTFFLFKALMLLCFLGTVWCIGKILQRISPENEKWGIAFFALSPFVLIESLVSAHNDIVMIFFMMVGVYFLVQKKYILTYLSLLLFYGIKFASPEIPVLIHVTIILGLFIILFIFSKIQKKYRWETWFILAGSIMIIPIILASIRSNFQPWYFLSLFPFAALVVKRAYIRIPLIILSLFALFEYIPYLFLGNWDPPIPSYLLIIRIIGISIAMLVLFLTYLFVKKSKNGTI